MPESTLSTFQTALITGGAGGIGKALAIYLISQGKKVIIAGRTESTLRETAQSIGASAYYVLDTGKTLSIPSFVSKITQDHPDLDCLINNAGVQRPLTVISSSSSSSSSFSPTEFLEKADQEIDINIRGPMHLAISLLNHFKTKKSAAIINISSVLGYLPSSVINPVYNGTKAWVHFFTLNLRTQLKDTTAIKVVEIVPPTVSTNLHRERADPDDNKKDKNDAALSLDEFMDFIKKGWEDGKETIGAGSGVDIVNTWEAAFGKQYAEVDNKFDPSVKP